MHTFKAAFAGALALALAGSFSVSTSTSATAQSLVSLTGSGIHLTEDHIAYIRTVLRLTPEQQPYWRPVEAALRGMAQPQARGSGGLLQQIGHGASGLFVDLAALNRLANVAAPLIRSLDPAQKRDAVRVAQAMGFGHLVAAF